MSGLTTDRCDRCGKYIGFYEIRGGLCRQCQIDTYDMANGIKK